jgi:hypothetical protein
MHTPQELNTVWELFILLEKLSNILFDRYHNYLIERHLDEENILFFENHLRDLIRKKSTQYDIFQNDPK